MKEIDMKEIGMKKFNRLALGGVGWIGKVAMFCLGLVAMAALVVVMSVLTAVMLMATSLPATVVWQKRDLRGRRVSTNTSEFSAPRKAMASLGQEGR